MIQEGPFQRFTEVGWSAYTIDPIDVGNDDSAPTYAGSIQLHVLGADYTADFTGSTAAIETSTHGDYSGLALGFNAYLPTGWPASTSCDPCTGKCLGTAPETWVTYTIPDWGAGGYVLADRIIVTFADSSTMTIQLTHTCSWHPGPSSTLFTRYAS
jgi:hypothetical protein